LKNSVNLGVKCTDCPIHHRAVCSKCEGRELERLESIKKYRSFRAGETIIWRGDELPFVASVVSGVASLNKGLEDGRTQMVGLLLPSDFIGHPGRTRIEFDVVACSDVLLCCFDRRPFQQLLDEMPHISQRMIELAMDELDAARDWMLLLGRKTAGEKIATFIEMVVRRQHFERRDGIKADLVLPLSRSDIANYLGLTLETVSRQIGQLKSNGVLEFIDKRRFRVRDMERLQQATGDDDDGGMIS
jgi:CRP/FNR family transcriptional regulator, anaerobic regulatory protein